MSIVSIVLCFWKISKSDLAKTEKSSVLQNVIYKDADFHTLQAEISYHVKTKLLSTIRFSVPWFLKHLLKAESSKKYGLEFSEPFIVYADVICDARLFVTCG